MSLDTILEKQNDFAIFGGIEPSLLAKVSDLFQNGSYPAGTRIIQESARGNRIYILTSGRVQVSVRCQPLNQADTEAILATLGRGLTFGEMEMLDTQERSATVTAIETTETIEITNMGLYHIFLREPEVFRMIILNIARDLSRRLRLANQQLAAIGSDPQPK